MELKDKIKKEEQIQELTNSVNSTESAMTSKVKEAIAKDNKVSEAIAALQVLGYNKKEIEKAFEKITDKEQMTTEEMIKIRTVLKRLKIILLRKQIKKIVL